PELWKDIQGNVEKMDDLYDATFYTWLKSEDNVLVTASYLQRLASEYDLDRIEHALCWLVNQWQLESIAVLVKQVTFDWVVTKGDQGELDRAKLILAITDNWGIQYIARLACILLTGATASSSPQLMPGRRMAVSRRLGSPMAMSTITNAASDAIRHLGRTSSTSLFMEELSKKWSFCRLSEFFQHMDPASGISHRFKCKLLKESALKEEKSQKQSATSGSKRDQTTKQQIHEEQSKPSESNSREEQSKADGGVIVSPIDPNQLGSDKGAMDISVDVEMMENDETPSTTSQMSTAAHVVRRIHDPDLLHPFDSAISSSSTTINSTRNGPISTPINVSQHEQTQYHSIQNYTHGDYNDDMNSGLSRGCKPAENSHQHCRSQTVNATMCSGLGITGTILTSSSSSCSSSASSPTSTAAASASLSTLTLTESGMEPSSKPLSQPQSHQHQSSLPPYNSNFSTPGLYRHATAHSATASSPSIPNSSTSVATPSSTTTLSIHANTSQRHTHDSTSTKRKNSLGVSLTPQSHCSSFSSTSSSSATAHSSADASMPSSSSIFPGARRTSTSTSTTNEDLKRLRCSRQNSTTSTSGI
ncbi:hypothetical protein BGZ46_003922, partial [Entomortierella lignicola]